jgi:hypothetical protein
MAVLQTIAGTCTVADFCAITHGDTVDAFDALKSNRSVTRCDVVPLCLHARAEADRPERESSKSVIDDAGGGFCRGRRQQGVFCAAESVLR